MKHPKFSGLHLCRTCITVALIVFSTPFTHAADPDYQTTADFATGLFTDLAPLLSLFGTEFSKQFLSQSIDWTDDFLFAMAPLGILTIVVGAIRVSGYSWIRTLIGRAREPSSASEIEFLSSTSNDVCETWDKKGVTRKANGQRIKAVLYDDRPGHQDVFSMWEAEFTSHPTERPYITRRDKNWNQFKVPEDPEETREWNLLPPNLTLNAHASIDNRFPIWFFAVVGFFVQAGAIVFEALTVYYWKWLKDGEPVANFAFPLAGAGSVMVCIGVFLCADVIERSTTKIVWIPAERTKLEKRTIKLLWVQQGQFGNVPDSYAIHRDPGGDTTAGEFRPIWGSYRKGKFRDRWWLNLEVLIGTFFCICGFPIQFTGLRALHFSATLAQLIAMMVMTGIRCWVRRGLSEEPRVTNLETRYELDQVALQISGLKSFRPGPRFMYWKDIDGTENREEKANVRE